MKELYDGLHGLSYHMREVAFLLDAKNDPQTDNFRRHAKELKGAAALVEEWIMDIKKEREKI